jgi:hypothetical protein
MVFGISASIGIPRTSIYCRLGKFEKQEDLSMTTIFDEEALMHEIIDYIYENGPQPICEFSLETVKHLLSGVGIGKCVREAGGMLYLDEAELARMDRWVRDMNLKLKRWSGYELAGK